MSTDLACCPGETGDGQGLLLMPCLHGAPWQMVRVCDCTLHRTLCCMQDTLGHCSNFVHARGLGVRGVCRY